MSTRKAYDAVVVGDDAALNFMELYQEELFPETPIIFEGIDNVDNAIEAAKDPYVTGVVEQVDYEKNLELAKKLFPSSKKLVFLFDNGENGIGIQKQIQQESQLFEQYEVEDINSSEYTSTEFCQKISEIDSNSIVFCMSVSTHFKDGTFSQEQCWKMLNDYATVPMLRMASAGVGSGAMLGGYIVSHLESGRIAGEMVKESLEQQDIASMEVNLTSPNKYYFDWNTIKRFEVKVNALPEDATIINQELTFIEKYYVQIIAASAGVCFLLLICVVIIYVKSNRRHNRMNRQLDQKNKEMDQKNKELELKNEQLSDAIHQADSANSAKSDFLARMSHEIRTPMNAIVGLTALARQHESEPARMEDYLVKIDTSSKVLLNIINDVLDMSAIENNKLKIGRADFDIKHILNGITTIYYPQCEDKGIHFEMATNIRNELLVGDSLRVNQILLNLVSNAYKFTDKDGIIRISVEERNQKDNTVFLRFEVMDTGCGMSQDMVERLFRPFEQETADTAKKHGGSGLGLSIAKNLVELMHGAIRVTSEKGKGTTFIVDLPFEISEQERQPENPQALKKLKILVVDDDESAREYTAVVLTRIGVGFEAASSGEEALEKIGNAIDAGEPYDVCLIDWKMPDMDGVSVTKSIRQMEEDKTTIIIVSAYDLNEVEDTAVAAGADEFVAKPLFQSTLFDELMKLTSGHITKKPEQVENQDFTGHKVLLAEDVPLNAEIAMELLELVHMDVDHASNGRQALEMFENHEKGTYDLILMDVQMPEMDGYEATRAIRSLEREDAGTIPIYAMTANAFTEDVSAAISAGMNGHIAKPIDTTILYNIFAKEIQAQD